MSGKNCHFVWDLFGVDLAKTVKSQGTGARKESSMDLMRVLETEKQAPILCSQTDFSTYPRHVRESKGKIRSSRYQLLGL